MHNLDPTVFHSWSGCHKGSSHLLYWWPYTAIYVRMYVRTHTVHTFHSSDTSTVADTASTTGSGAWHRTPWEQAVRAINTCIHIYIHMYVCMYMHIRTSGFTIKANHSPSTNTKVHLMRFIMRPSIYEPASTHYAWHQAVARQLPVLLEGHLTCNQTSY